MIATLGGAACAYFVLIDTAFAASGRDGGLLGGLLHRGLHALVGDAGVWIVLIVAFLAVTVAITGVSVKKVIGWCATRLAALRVPPGARRGGAPGVAARSVPSPGAAPGAARDRGAAALAAPGLPAATHTVVEPPPVRFYDEELAADDADEDDDDDDADEDEDDESYDDDAYDEDAVTTTTSSPTSPRTTRPATWSPACRTALRKSR